MTEDVKTIVSSSYQELIGSEKVMILLKVYSKLYLNGAQPGTCGQCLRDAYNQILKNGMDLAKKYEEATTRTCQPAWTGLKYIPATARHWNDELITDEDAIYLLIQGYAQEKDFAVLPKEWAPKAESKVKTEVKKQVKK